MADADQSVAITRGSAALLGRMVKDFRGRGRGEQPLPKRRRGAAGAAAGSGTRKARVTTTIPAATTAAAAGWGTTGEVMLCDETSGLPTGDPIAVTNEWPNAWAVDCQVELKMAYSPPRVLGGTCEPQDAVTYWGDEA